MYKRLALYSTLRSIAAVAIDDTTGSTRKHFQAVLAYAERMIADMESYRAEKKEMLDRLNEIA
jgi:hypothetical protein